MVRKSDEYIFPRICGKNVVKSRKSSAKENVTPCTEREFIPSLSPYKIAKIDALASKLAGRYFCYFAWLVAFTNSSQKISTHLLTVLIISVILQLEQRKGNKKRTKK